MYVLMKGNSHFCCVMGYVVENADYGHPIPYLPPPSLPLQLVRSHAKEICQGRCAGLDRQGSCELAPLCEFNCIAITLTLLYIADVPLYIVLLVLQFILFSSMSVLERERGR